MIRHTLLYTTVSIVEYPLLPCPGLFQPQWHIGGHVGRRKPRDLEGVCGPWYSARRKACSVADRSAPRAAPRLISLQWTTTAAWDFWLVSAMVWMLSFSSVAQRYSCYRSPVDICSSFAPGRTSAPLACGGATTSRLLRDRVLACCSSLFSRCRCLYPLTIDSWNTGLDCAIM